MDNVNRPSTLTLGSALMTGGAGRGRAAGGGKSGAAKRNIRLKAVLGLCTVLMAFSAFDRVAAASGHQFQYCSGYFALCAASTCTPTGRTVKVNVTGGGTAQFPEADCTCPIVSGDGIADLAGGNMNGSCAPPAPSKIWSLFTTTKYIPQAINGWATTGPGALAPPQFCSKNLNLGDKAVNCFSFACDSQTYINGVPVATCHCAVGESFAGTAVPAHTTFWTAAGQRDKGFCATYPAAVPLGFGD